MPLPDPLVIAAVVQAGPWAGVAMVLAWAVVVLVDGKTGMRAMRTELREVRAQLERERNRGDRLERVATQREP